MKFAIIRGFQDPRDPKAKPRFAVVLGMENGRMALAPVTTYPARTGRTPDGAVRLSDRSEAFKGTGFDADEVAISMRDVVLVNTDSVYLRGHKVVGRLDLHRDKRVFDQFVMLLRQYGMPTAQY